MSVQALLLVWLGFALLCLAMPRHCMDILPGRKLSTVHKRLLQLGGAVLLFISARSSVAADGLGIGLTAWTGLLTLALVLQALLLSYLPRLLPASCAVALLGIVAAF